MPVTSFSLLASDSPIIGGVGGNRQLRPECGWSQELRSGERAGEIIGERWGECGREEGRCGVSERERWMSGRGRLFKKESMILALALYRSGEGEDASHTGECGEEEMEEKGTGGREEGILMGDEVAWGEEERVEGGGE